MRQVVDREPGFRPRREHACDRDPPWGEAFPDEENDAERLLDDPVSEIKNTESSKRDEAKKRE